MSCTKRVMIGLPRGVTQPKCSHIGPTQMPGPFQKLQTQIHNKSQYFKNYHSNRVSTLQSLPFAGSSSQEVKIQHQHPSPEPECNPMNHKMIRKQFLESQHSRSFTSSGIKSFFMNFVVNVSSIFHENNNIVDYLVNLVKFTIVTIWGQQPYVSLFASQVNSKRFKDDGSDPCMD